jgi:hypothetical protein
MKYKLFVRTNILLLYSGFDLHGEFDRPGSILMNRVKQTDNSWQALTKWHGSHAEASMTLIDRVVLFDCS